MAIVPDYLYIHIPFCKHICAYCDFVRKIAQNNNEIKQYVNKIINQVNEIPSNHIFKTIYIGGGTPNSLDNELLNELLKVCKKHANQDTEFTIECNPEFINEQQVKLFKENCINRISIGVQSVNPNILKIFNRKHDIEQVTKAIQLLREYHINNISLDFIYGFNKMTNQDIIDDINFIYDNKIPHVSFYSLEIKPNSIFGKTHQLLDEEQVDNQFKLIINNLKELGYTRYEVSNWAIDKNHHSKHNLTYWNSFDWLAIGLGAYGLENLNYYHYVGNINDFKKESTIYSLKEYYQHILIMGLRLVNGLNLNIKVHNDAYMFFKNKINKDLIEIKNNHLRAKNINCLGDILIQII